MTCHIMGTFKTGTSTLFELIKNNTDLKVTKTHVNLPLLKNNKYDYIIFTFRNNKEVFPSAFFQDIVVPTYPYSPFYSGNFLDRFSNLDKEKRKKIILDIDVEKLLELYNTSGLKKYHDNNKFRQDLNQLYNINIKDTMPIQYFSHENTKLICVRTEKLSNKFYLQELLNSMNYQLKTDIIHANNGEKKWYNEKYKKFKLLLKR